MNCETSDRRKERWTKYNCRSQSIMFFYLPLWPNSTISAKVLLSQLLNSAFAHHWLTGKHFQQSSWMAKPKECYLFIASTKTSYILSCYIPSHLKLKQTLKTYLSGACSYATFVCSFPHSIYYLLAIFTACFRAYFYSFVFRPRGIVNIRFARKGWRANLLSRLSVLAMASRCRQ